MTPFHFGTRQRRLFAVYDAAHQRFRSPRAVVLCQPLGSEHLFAYRTMRQLGGRLAQAGFHVLRFDYYGTGDSSGETEKIDFSAWSEDVEMAIDEIMAMTGAAKVTLVGLRLGANLAAQAAVRRANEVEKLVLWEPLLSGELEAVVAATVIDLEEPGFQVAPASPEDIRQIGVETVIGDLPRKTLVVLMREGALPEALTGLQVEQSGGDIPWIEDRTITGTVPAETMSQIVNWSS